MFDQLSFMDTDVSGIEVKKLQMIWIHTGMWNTCTVFQKAHGTTLYNMYMYFICSSHLHLSTVRDKLTVQSSFLPNLKMRYGGCGCWFGQQISQFLRSRSSQHSDFVLLGTIGDAEHSDIDSRSLRVKASKVKLSIMDWISAQKFSFSSNLD